MPGCRPGRAGSTGPDVPFPGHGGVPAVQPDGKSCRLVIGLVISVVQGYRSASHSHRRPSRASRLATAKVPQPLGLPAAGDLGPGEHLPPALAMSLTKRGTGYISLDTEGARARLSGRDGGDRPKSPGGGLIPVTVSEVRRLLAHLTARVPSRADAWAWSNWRRHHQHRARTSHYQRRQAIYNEVLL
jgi:hypothetical protein